MKYFICPHCNTQLFNQNRVYKHANPNEFWCEDCGKVYIINEKNIIEEEDW